MENYIGDNLKKVRLLKNLSLREAGSLLGMSAPAISKYEKGDIIPNSTKLIEFAKAYQVKTIDFLSVYNYPKMKFECFRKSRDLQGEKLDLIKRVISEEVAKYLELLELSEETNKEIKLPKYACATYDDIEIASIKFREKVLRIGNNPLTDLITILEGLGIYVILLKNDNNLFDGFKGLCEVVNNKPFIIILEEEDGFKQRFTIAHELAHLVLKIDEASISKEKACNLFAGALLMPKSAITNEFGNPREIIRFYELEAFRIKYCVDYFDILHRLKNLCIISDYFYNILNHMIIDDVKNVKPSTLPVEKSYKYVSLVLRLEAQNIITKSKAAQLLGITVDEFIRQYSHNRY